jgi:hypothetical protein
LLSHDFVGGVDEKFAHSKIAEFHNCL